MTEALEVPQSSQSPHLNYQADAAIVVSANAVVTGRKVGPVPTRRYQEGCFKRENGFFYSFFRQDVEMPDGSTKSKLTRFKLGQVGVLSELQARREHDRIRATINRVRGSVPAAPKGETFRDVAANYMKAIGPQLSPATMHQRQSHLNAHLLSRFGDSALMAIGFGDVQQFATDVMNSREPKISSKHIVNILGSFAAVLAYAKECKIRVPDVDVSKVRLAEDNGGADTPYMKALDVKQLLPLMREPYRTIFSLYWVTALRANEVLGLRVQDVDLVQGFVNPCVQADEKTRVLRPLKTKKSKSPVPITPETAAMLKTYLEQYWRPNPLNLLFPCRTDRPIKRKYVVKFGLRPALVKLGLPTYRVGPHAFRRGAGTCMADSKVSPRIVQSILRHTDIKTTMRCYVHSDADVQRQAVQALQL